MPGRRPVSGFVLDTFGPGPDASEDDNRGGKNGNDRNQVKRHVETQGAFAEQAHVAKASGKQGLRHVDATIRDRHAVIEDQGLRSVLSPEGARGWQALDQDRHREHDPEQHGHVAEHLDIDGHDAGDQPVPGQARDADKDTDDRCRYAAQDRDDQRVQKPDE